MISVGLNPRAALVLTAATIALSCQLPGLYRNTGPAPVKTVRLPGPTLVMAPTTLPDDFELGEQVGVTLDSAISETLAELGYDVVASEAYRGIWDSLTAAAGGFFDPFTGRRNQDAYDAAVTVLFDALKKRFAPDAVLYPGLWVTEAETDGGFASWDGYREYFAFRAFNGTVVLGLSLLISVEDMAGVVVHSGEAGVRLIERYDSTDGAAMIESIDARLTPEVLGNAVARVLKPLSPRDTIVTDTTVSR